MVEAVSPENGTPKSTQDMVIHLLNNKKMSAEEISEALGRRVSKRTVYRWAKGESQPQQVSDFDELQRLYVERTSS